MDNIDYNLLSKQILVSYEVVCSNADEVILKAFGMSEEALLARNLLIKSIATIKEGTADLGVYIVFVVARNAVIRWIARS